MTRVAPHVDSRASGCVSRWTNAGPERNERKDQVSVAATLPTGPDAGTRGSWALPVGREGAVRQLPDATFVGYGTTQTSRHTNHDDSDFAPRSGARCSACRWYETRLFKVHDPSGNHPDHYIIHHSGASRVPGEVYLFRYEEAWSAHEVVELFTVRPDPDDTDSHGRQRTPFLTRPGARTLAMAARFDDDVDDAYINRNVQ